MATKGSKKDGWLDPIQGFSASIGRASQRSSRVNGALVGGLRLSQLSALSLLEMSSSESLGVENAELLSTSSYLRLRPRDDPASMETPCLRAESSRRQATEAAPAAPHQGKFFLQPTLIPLDKKTL